VGVIEAPAASHVVIVGGGLAGALLALALREEGAAVCLIDSPAQGPSATAISYGVVPGWSLAPTPLARLAAGASRHWRQLQRRHGFLGWRPCRLRLHGGRPWLGALAAWVPLPLAQVDSAELAARLPAVLAAAGVQRRTAWVERLQPLPQAWQLQLRDGSTLQASQVVLAAGARCRQLWQPLPERLRASWAAVLALSSAPPPAVAAPLARSAAPLAWLPARFGRVALERRAAGLSCAEWLVDGGLVPRGGGALLGQHTLVRPGLELGDPPARAETERQLRAALADQPWAAQLASLPGQLQQTAVAFCTDGGPLVGPAAGAPGLWLFTGFSAGFSQVPVLAPLLAQALVAGGRRAVAAQRRLRRLGLWSTDPLPEPDPSPECPGADRIG
jgi:glycine/D-amino acid oxidase-like deaminating enzyme